MTDSPTQGTLACQVCGGRLEAAAKIYFDLTAAERLADGRLAVTGIDVAESNDFFDGHPAAMDSEFVVSCSDCGERVDYRLAGTALARTEFYGAVGAGSSEALR